MRRYSVQMNGISVAAAKTLIRITAPATMVLLLLRAKITQSGSVTSTQARGTIQRASTAGTGTAETPEKLESGDPVATFTAITDLTAEPTLTGDPILDEGFNWLNGMLWVPAPEERIWVPPSGIALLRLPTLGATMTVSAEIILGEVG